MKFDQVCRVVRESENIDSETANIWLRRPPAAPKGVKDPCNGPQVDSQVPLIDTYHGFQAHSGVSGSEAKY